MDAKRKVVFYKWERTKTPGKYHYDKVAEGTGVFHGWGVDYEEFEGGPGNYSTAIIELPDQSVRNIPVDLIVFND